MPEFRFYPSAVTQARTASWSIADIRLLRDLAQRGMPLNSIARALHRTESAVRNKAGMHGISLQRLHGQKSTDAAAGRMGQPVRAAAAR